ncbi:hypothetical protein KCU92_g9845, partial [Aureobasidium melanogenum]
MLVTVNSFPNEVSLDTLQHIDYSGFEKCMRVNKAFNAIIKHTALDRVLFRSTTVIGKDSILKNSTFATLPSRVSQLHLEHFTKIRENNNAITEGGASILSTPATTVEPKKTPNGKVFPKRKKTHITTDYKNFHDEALPTKSHDGSVSHPEDADEHIDKQVVAHMTAYLESVPSGDEGAGVCSAIGAKSTRKHCSVLRGITTGSK